MFFKKNNFYVHMPAQKLLKEMDRFFSLNLNCEVLIASSFIENHLGPDITCVRERFLGQGLSLRVHGPFIDLNPGSADKDIRRFSLKRFQQALALCEELGSKAMVLHSHYEPIFYKNYFDLWLKNSEEVWAPLAEDAGKKGITICIENSLDDGPRAISAILNKYKSFGACLDLAHYNVFSSLKLSGILKDYPAGSIREVHLSDNKGDEDSHLALGEGDIDFEGSLRALKARGEDPVFTIEPHTEGDLLKSLEYIKRFII